MPRNPNNKRIEVLLSPEQYEVLVDYFSAEYPGADLAEGIRRSLREFIPSFAKAAPLLARGKYERKPKRKYICPECGSTDTHYHSDIRSDDEYDDLIAMKYECDNCGEIFKDSDAESKVVE